MAYPIARICIRPVLRFFIRSIKGLEHVPRSGPLIVACRHTGPLDGLFIVAALVPRLNQKIHFIAKRVRWVWLWQKLVVEKWAGCIPLRMDRPRGCLEVAQKKLERGGVVGIFPEGLLQEREKNMGRGKTGVARLALWTRAPVLPVGLHNFHVVNRGEMIWKHLRNPHNMRITIGEPMTFPDAYDSKITHDLLRSVTDRIVDRIESLSVV